MATPFTPAVTISTAGSGAGTIICASRPGRRLVTIQNTSATASIYHFGTTTTGYPVPKGTSIQLDTTAAIVAASAGGSEPTACVETFV